MPTQINQLYTDLLPIIPEYMSAINVCLVKGWLRPATIVEPNILRNIPVDFRALERVIHNYGLLTRRWGKSLLVFQPTYLSDVEEAEADLENHHLIGTLLGYRCPGDLKITGTRRYFINFVVLNPISGNENSFLGYVCVSIPQELVDDLRDEGREFERFLRYHQITNAVKLRIWYFQNQTSPGTSPQIDVINEWL